MYMHSLLLLLRKDTLCPFIFSEGCTLGERVKVKGIEKNQFLNYNFISFKYPIPSYTTPAPTNYQSPQQHYCHSTIISYTFFIYLKKKKKVYQLSSILRLISTLIVGCSMPHTLCLITQCPRSSFGFDEPFLHDSGVNIEPIRGHLLLC